MKTHYTRWGCIYCGKNGLDGFDDLWINEGHTFVSVESVHLVNERGVELDHPKVSDPNIKVSSIGFRGWIVEPEQTKCNMWEFWIKNQDEVWGRPCGASVSTYRPPGTTKRRKRGEWYPTPWVPKDAVNACIKLFVKV